MSDNLTTATTTDTTNTSAPSSEFRPRTPPLNAKRAAYGPPPPAYETHFTESPTDEVSPGFATEKMNAQLERDEGTKARSSSVVQPSPQVHKPRSRKSSTVSTSSARTSRSTVGKGTSTWRPGAPFPSSTTGVSVAVSGGGDSRALVSAVTVNAAGSISSLDIPGTRDSLGSRASSHARAKTTSAVPAPLDLTLPSMASSSSASATLETARSTTSATPATLSVPAVSASSSNLRLSPSISRLRNIASSARRRDSVSSTISNSSNTSTSSHTIETPSSSALDLPSTSPETVETAVAREGEDEASKGDVLQGESNKGKERADLGVGNGHSTSSTSQPFKSRIPTPSTTRSRTTSTSSTHLQRRHSMALKSLPVTDTTSVSITKMGEIATEGSGLLLVGMINGALEGAGEISQLKGGPATAGSTNVKGEDTNVINSDSTSTPGPSTPPRRQSLTPTPPPIISDPVPSSHSSPPHRQSTPIPHSPPSKLPIAKDRVRVMSKDQPHDDQKTLGRSVSATSLPIPSSTKIQRKKDWFSSLTRTKGKAVASVGVAMIQSESSGLSGEGEERDVKSILEDIHAAHMTTAEGKLDEQLLEGAIKDAEESLSTVEINVLPATPQLEDGVPMFVSNEELSLSSPLPSSHEEHERTPSPPSLAVPTPPSPTRSSPRTISGSNSRSVPHTPARKSRSWFSSPLSGSPLGVSVFTASGYNNANTATGDDEPSSHTTPASSSPPSYISPPPIEDPPQPPLYIPPPPPPEDSPPNTPPNRSNSIPSLDSVVPSLPGTPPGTASSQGEGASAPLLRRKTSNTSLNASSGRFLLSFGLHGILGLGREKEKVKENEVEARNMDTVDDEMKAEGHEVAEAVEIERTESIDTVVHAETIPDVGNNVLEESPLNNDVEAEDLSATIRGNPVEKSERAKGKERVVENGWWGIVGWGSVKASVDNENNDVEEEDQGVQEVAEQGDGGSDGDGKDADEEEEGEGTVKGVPTVVQDQVVEDETTKSEEAIVAEEEQRKEDIAVPGNENGVVVGSAAWFARWTWYSSSQATSVACTNNEDEAKDTDANVEESVEEAHEPESQPMEESNAAVYIVPEPSSPPPAGPSIFDENPITSTMSSAAQRSIWSSIFTSTYAMTVSRSGTVKAIEDGRAIDNVERDEHGAEVMDIESDEETTAQPEPTSLQSKALERKSRGWAGPMRMVVSAVSSSASRDASVERRQSSGPKYPASHNGNISDITGSTATTTTTTTKDMPGDAGNGKEGGKGGQKSGGKSDMTTTSVTTLSTITALSKRTGSPAPSTTSSSGTTSKPIGPPPPNLVLPTWEDTFFVPPRNYVDPPPIVTTGSQPGSPGEESVLSKGLIGGALRLVSGVLGSPQPPPPPHQSTSRQRASSQPPSPHIHEPPNPLRFIGRDLPKAYQVLEEAGYDTSAPPEYSPSPAYSNMSPPPHFSPRSTRSPSLPRSPTTGIPSSPPKTAASGFSFFGGGPKRAASPPPDIPEPVPMEEVRDVLRGCKRVVVIGVHGWFPGSMIRTVLGEPTGTSSKFANMMALALHHFELEMDVKFEKVTKVVLEGEGEVKRRVDKLYSTLLSHPTHLNDIHNADAILVSTHSQGSVVSTHILDRLIKDGHIVTRQSIASQMFGERDADDERKGEVIGIGGEVYPGSLSGLPSSSTPANGEGLPWSAGTDAPPLSRRTSAFDDSKPRKHQRVCCLAMCGIHLGPLRYLNSSSFVGPYIQYLESHAARELFEFQNTESAVSKAYVKALEGVLDAGVKMVYVASLNDQVVPIYSGLFTAVHHPSILRALYIDGDAYSTSDFLCALLVLLIRVINAGLPDSGLIAHLSEATAGSLSGVGHSAAYEELATYSLAVKYLFLVDEGAMANINNNPLETSPPPTAASHTPFFLSPTFSSFSPLPHHSHSAYASPSHPSTPLPPLPKPRMQFTPFSAHTERNDYEIPWSLRDLIAHPVISYLFHREIEELRDKFGEWNPKTATLRDVKRKVSPIARLGNVGMGMMGGMNGFGMGMGMGSTSGSKL